uniref:Uncharacterized protein n=1 Tax=Arundo donax TaxID=35708 RepID=A0A0A9BWV2_ARUDO
MFIFLTLFTAFFYDCVKILVSLVDHILP